MTVYTISGATLTLDNLGGTGNIAANEAINPITGSMGINTVRVVNTSTANLCTMGYTLSNTTYSFDNVTGTASAGGANAAFNVTVANSGYNVSIANAGNGYANLETIVISGDDLGGTSTANDLTLTLTVATVANVAGVIQSVTSAGTVLWPQSETGNITLLPRTEDFIQISSSGSLGSYFGADATDGNLLITPVSIVG